MSFNQLLDKYKDLMPVYGSGLTNHLNMSMYSQYALGKDQASIIEFAEWYIQSKDIKKVLKTDVDIDDFHGHLGQQNAYDQLVRFYEKEIETKGYEKVLKDNIDELLLGSAGDAFHGLIRLAYAVEVKDDKEVARALAYLSDAYVDFHIEVDKLSPAEPLQTAKALSESEHFKTKKFQRPLIIGRMIDVAEDEAVMTLLKLLPDDRLNIKAMHEVAITLYAMTRDFTMLHGFTSTHALSILLPYINDVEKALHNHWLNLQVAYLSTNCVKLTKIPRTKAMAWSEIFSLAITSSDDHTHKLTYSLYQTEKIYANEKWSNLYRMLASDRIENDQSIKRT